MQPFDRQCTKISRPSFIVSSMYHERVPKHAKAGFKVEKILKGSLDSIPSPSVKIQIMGGKVCLRYKGKTLLGVLKKKPVC